MNAGPGSKMGLGEWMFHFVAIGMGWIVSLFIGASCVLHALLYSDGANDALGSAALGLLFLVFAFLLLAELLDLLLEDS